MTNRPVKSKIKVTFYIRVIKTTQKYFIYIYVVCSFIKIYVDYENLLLFILLK